MLARFCARTSSPTTSFVLYPSLGPDLYGGGDPILYGPMGGDIEIPEEYYSIFEGPFEVQVEVFYPDGSLFACNFVKLVQAEH